MNLSVPGRIEAPATVLADRLGALCPEHGVDLAGAVGLDGPAPHAAAWLDWLGRGLHGGLGHLERTGAERADPRRHVPWARSLLVLAQRYTDGWPDPDDTVRDAVPGDWPRHVARFARGHDYHDSLLRAAEGVIEGLREVWPGLVARAAVDTGPYLERDWAAQAGLGFIGKNTCLIHERLGSGLVLAVAPTNLELIDLAGLPRPLYSVVERGRRGRTGADRCGRCTLCLDACPTGALIEPRVLDAGRCLSTWTIERKGRAPQKERRLQGDRLFGCDVCQQVCPWNARAARRAAEADPWPPLVPDYASLPGHAQMSLADLIMLDDDGFRRRFRGTPLWRAHPEGMRRNAVIVAANTGRVDLLDVVRRVCESDPDLEVRAVAAWAVFRLRERS